MHIETLSVHVGTSRALMITHYEEDSLIHYHKISLSQLIKVQHNGLEIYVLTCKENCLAHVHIYIYIYGYALA